MRQRTGLVLAGLALAAFGATAADAGGSAYTATAKGGRLVLAGDATASALALRATDAPFTFVVEGLDGATIDGAASAEFAGVTRGITLDLGGGDDRLLITARGPEGPVLEPIFPALSIRAGAGDDVVAFDHVLLGGKLAVELGDGADTAAVWVSSLRAVASLIGGEGDDVAFVGLASEIRAKLSVKLELGQDVVVVENVPRLEGKLTVALGAGDDAAGFADLPALPEGKLDGGLGDDELREDGSAAALRAKGVERQQQVDNQVVFELIEALPGFGAAVDLVNAHGVGLN